LFASDEAYITLDECIDDAHNDSSKLFSIVNLVQGHPARKKQKTQDLKPVVFVRFNSCLGKAKPITLKCLMDTGASGSLVAQKHTKKLRLKQLPGQQSAWTTPAGNVFTTHKCRSAFVLPKFHRDKIIKWDLNVSESLGAYNMIIGRDLLSGLVKKLISLIYVHGMGRRVRSNERQ
jgi:hypothetical protein